MADSGGPAASQNEPEPITGDSSIPAAGQGENVSAGAEATTPGRLLLPDTDDGVGDGGLRWSFDFDLEAVLAATGRSLDAGDEADQDEILAASNSARDRDDGSSSDLTGLIAENLPTGPGLAAWLSQLDPAALADRDVPGAAAAFRKVASWAQAAELALVAQVAARSAARDDKVGLGDDGRPAEVTKDAAAQVSLGLTLSPCGAESWTHLAVTLQWRLPRTAAALAAGEIDLYRARVIAEAVGPLSDAAAHEVEDKVLSGAGGLSYGQLHAAVRRAVIAADPEGAERRREAAERQAKVSLYPDEDHTASLAGSRLPAIHAAAAMARISAMARALKASGAGGGIDLLRAHVFLGLLLGTLPLIPPPADGPPDNPPPPDADPPDEPSGPPGRSRPDPSRAAARPRRPGATHRGGARPPGARDARESGSHRDDTGPPDMPAPDTGSGQRPDSPPYRPPDRPPPDQAPPDQAPPDPAPPDGPPPDAPPPDRPPRDWPPPGAQPPDAPPPDAPPPDAPPPDAPPPDRPAPDPLWPDPPWPSDADAPEDDGYREPPLLPGGLDDEGRFWGDPLEDHYASTRPVPAWPMVPATVPATHGAGQAGAGTPPSAAGRPPGGLLDLSLPWATLTCESAAPGTIGRIGPATATQVRRLARIATTDHATQWRIILTDHQGRAIGVGRIPQLRLPAGYEQPGTAGLVGRVTVTVPEVAIRGLPPGDPDDDRILSSILRVASRTQARAAELALANRDAPAGCAHPLASSAYRPPPRIREYVIARDVTCRYPFCGQPAWRGDLDHTQSWHSGGLTCSCNLGPLCRAHHLLKQMLGWCLTQPRPGIFQWVTPAGCAYTVHPDLHLS